jgi:hypothetical protein
MKKSELKEMIKAAFMAENQEEQGADDILASLMGTDKDPYMAEEKDMDEMVADLYEAEDEEEVATDIDVDAEEGGDEEVDVDVDVDAEEEAPAKNDSVVIDKKIVSLSSLPGDTRKILDTLETLRAQAEEFGDQKFMTQVGNTITFFTRDFVVAGDAPNPQGIEENTINEDLASMVISALEPESLEALKMMATKLQTSPQALINGLSGVLAGVTTVATAGKALTSDKFGRFVKGIMGKEEEKKPEVEEGDESANLEREAELELESLNEVKRMKKLAGIIK